MRGVRLHLRAPHRRGAGERCDSGVGVGNPSIATLLAYLSKHRLPSPQASLDRRGTPLLAWENPAGAERMRARPGP